MRKHYMTLCVYNNTEVTHIKRDWGIEVSFEQAVTGGFKTLITTLDGKILKNDGFNPAEVDFFLRFLNSNKNTIIMESNGEI